MSSLVEQPYEAYRVLDLRRLAHRNEFARLLEGDEPTFASLSLYDLITSSDCRSVVVENDYIDRDHSRSFTSFYAHAFQDIPRRTTRLHFFATRLTNTRLDDELTDPDVRGSYRGFCALRPLHTKKIGRTVVLPPDSADPASHFPLGVSIFDVNIAGRSFSIRGAPFMEQDARVAACATTALWMSSESMSRRFGLPSYTTAEITDFATRILGGGRPIPSPGLNYMQMAEALRSMGYDPLMPAVTDRQTAIEQLYPYVESGIVPILLLRFISGNHAAAVVGHTFDIGAHPRRRTQVTGHGRSIRFWRSWQWVDGFLVNDDQRGLYRKLTFVDASEAKNAIRARYGVAGGVDRMVDEWECPVRVDMSTAAARGAADYGNLWGLLVPLPPRISLSAGEAHQKVARIIQVWYDIRGREVDRRLYLRTYLANSVEFKGRMSESENVHKFLRRLLRSKNLPRWIWVTEVGYRDELIRANLDQQVIRGEIILDANSSPWTPDFLCLHMPMPGRRGHLTTMRSTNIEYRDVARALRSGWILYGDRPYKPLLR